MYRKTAKRVVIGVIALCLEVSLLARAQSVPAPPPRLVLFVSVDQMRFDYLTRYGPLFKGGFRTLLDHGAVFTHALYRHASTETGPGHAVLLSGRSGAHSGIVANEWFDSALNQLVNVVDDPAVSPVGGRGRGASPSHFIGFTVGDMLKKRAPASRVVGVSLKDRSAILMAGPRADAAYWFETDGGNFITSSYYMKTAPTWLAKWNGRRLPDRYAGKTWERLKAEPDLYKKYAGEDDVKGEFDRHDVVFPHQIRGMPPTPQFYEELRRTPFADDLTLDVALAALDAYDMGHDEATDLLAVGFSATDIIGHAFGPDSQEQMDEFLRLDVTLGKLLDAAMRRAGADRTLVVLSADHGVLPLVELLQAKGIAARRVRWDEILAPAREALQARFGSADGIIALYAAPDFYLDLEGIRRRGLKRADVESVIEKAVTSTGLVERVYTQTQLMGEPPAEDPFFAAVRRSFFEPRSPHLIVILKQYLALSERPGGTTHGTPYEYDQHVPIIFMGAAVHPGLYDESCGPEDIAPTLARLLGLEYPQQDAVRLLTEMIRK